MFESFLIFFRGIINYLQMNQNLIFVIVQVYIRFLLELNGIFYIGYVKVINFNFGYVKVSVNWYLENF